MPSATVRLQRRDERSDPPSTSQHADSPADMPASRHKPVHIQLDSMGGDSVAIDLDGVEPPWLAPTIRASADLLQLPENWNSYGARPIQPSAIQAVLDLLFKTMDPLSPVPQLIPTNRGGVDLDWHTRGVDLEVKLVEPDRISVYCEDHALDRTWEAELDDDLTPLADVLSDLARRA